MVTHTIEELHELFKSGELDVKEYYKELFEEAKKKVIDYLEENKIGTRKVNYKLRDWYFQDNVIGVNQFQLSIWKMEHNVPLN